MQRRTAVALNEPSCEISLLRPDPYSPKNLMSDKKVGEAASFIPVWLCMCTNLLSWYLSSSRNDIVVKYFKWSLSWSVHIKGAIKTSGNFFSGAELCSCVRCLHNMFPTKIACILFSAYISVSFYHKFSHNIGCILSKTLPITLTKFKWKLRVVKGFFFGNLIQVWAWQFPVLFSQLLKTYKSSL